MASAVTQSRSPRKRATSSAVDDPPATDRSQMIAEAAYYLAEQRGFDGGDPVQDWLEAEGMIDQMQVSKGTKRRSRSK